MLEQVEQGIAQVREATAVSQTTGERSYFAEAFFSLARAQAMEKRSEEGLVTIAEGEEVKFFDRTPDEIRQALGDGVRANAFMAAYGVTYHGNFQAIPWLPLGFGFRAGGLSGTERPAVGTQSTRFV
jgi:hypothetical protein